MAVHDADGLVFGGSIPVVVLETGIAGVLPSVSLGRRDREQDDDHKRGCM